MNKKLFKQSISMIMMIGFIGLSGCGNSSSGYGGSSSGTSPVGAPIVQEVSCSGVSGDTVHILGNTFSPGSLTIATGAIVKWQNQDAIIHTVTGGTPSAADGRFDILMNPGTERCLKFTAAGNYPYYCKIHLEMTAQIIVQ